MTDFSHMEAKHCRSLWSAVLVLAIKDAKFSLGATSNPDIRRARDWLKSSACRNVADLAGFDGEAVQERLLSGRFSDVGIDFHMSSTGNRGRPKAVA